MSTSDNCDHEENRPSSMVISGLQPALRWDNLFKTPRLAGRTVRLTKFGNCIDKRGDAG